MRIVHLVEDLKRGGMEKLVADIVRGQRAAGHEVAIVCLWGRGETADELRDDGFAVSLIGTTRVRPAGLYAVRRTIRGLRADVAHLHGMPAGTFGRLALLGTGTKTLFHVHTQISIAHLMRPALARRERMLARLPGVILAISESVRRDLVDEIGLGETRIRVLSGGVPNVAPVDREQARRRFALSPDEFAVVSAAALNVHKCPEVLIRSFEGLTGARLLLAGEGPQEDELKALANELGLRESVRFLGHVTNVPELTTAADAIALASWPREGLSLSAIEGLRAGRPVVVTNVGGLPEVVEHDVSGYVVAPNEPQRFTEAFAKLHNDAALREAMGRRARQRFLEKFELQHYLEKLEALYRP